MKNIILYISFSLLLIFLFITSVLIADKFKGPNTSDVGVRVYPEASKAFFFGMTFLFVSMYVVAYITSSIFKNRSKNIIAITLFFAVLFIVLYYFIRKFY